MNKEEYPHFTHISRLGYSHYVTIDGRKSVP